MDLRLVLYYNFQDAFSLEDAKKTPEERRPHPQRKASSDDGSDKNTKKYQECNISVL